MPAYNFKEIFAPAVEAGRKLHTVRAPRKRPTVVGDLFVAYVNQRMPTRRELYRSVVTLVQPLTIHGPQMWLVDGVFWGGTQIAAFVAADTDGLWTPEAFVSFMERQYGPRARLEIVHWARNA